MRVEIDYVRLQEGADHGYKVAFVDIDDGRIYFWSFRVRLFGQDVDLAQEIARRIIPAQPADRAGLHVYGTTEQDRGRIHAAARRFRTLKRDPMDIYTSGLFSASGEVTTCAIAG